MNTIKLGVLCPSEIASRRFLPALQKDSNFTFVGLSTANEAEWFGSRSEKNDCTVLQKEREKGKDVIKTYGGKLFDSYQALLESPEIDAVYIPLPPALHFQWAKKALECGKHVFLEKPFTDSLKKTQELIALAAENQLAIHENYMFRFHSQLSYLHDLIAKKEIGDLRLFRIAFGFPFRGAHDFRYVKSLGGGALLDCGGYPVRLAAHLLGETAQIVASSLQYSPEFEVDIGGSATMKNDAGQVAQIAFGMDNSYKCELELWGSTGSVYTNRIYTAPVDFEPQV
ncbi:MAG: Gfo/Idh/MocA family oxidoreductase, partial [Oscillospiraceae bacterium]